MPEPKKKKNSPGRKRLDAAKKSRKDANVAKRKKNEISSNKST